MGACLHGSHGHSHGGGGGGHGHNQGIFNSNRNHQGNGLTPDNTGDDTSRLISHGPPDLVPSGNNPCLLLML